MTASAPQGPAPGWLIFPTDLTLVRALKNHDGNLALLVNREGTLIKRGGHRLVWRIHLDGLDIHVKRNQISGIRGQARRIFRGHKAHLEARRLLDLGKAGVPTLEVMGVAAEPGFFGASWIITRTAPDMQPLDRFLMESGGPLKGRARKEIATRLAGLMASMHQHGFHHTDLHPGNVLFSASASPAMVLLDVHDLKKTRPSWTANLANLIILNRWFHGRATRQDRWRFLKCYLLEFRNSLISGCPWSPRAMARLIEEKTGASKHRLWRSRDNRCFEINKDFQKVVINCSGTRGVGFAARTPVFARPDLVMPEPFPRRQEPLAGDRIENSGSHSRPPLILKQSKSSTVFQWTPDGAQPDQQGWIIKDIPARSWWHRATGNHPCRRSWHLGHALRGRFLPTPKPIAWIRFPDGSERLVQTVVSDSILLDAWWKSVKCPARRRELGRKLGAILRQMHGMGVRHRDLKASNLLVGPDDSPWLIDLVGVRLQRNLKAADREKDLARLARSVLTVGGVSPGEMLGFLRSYQGGRLSPQWKLFVLNILRLAQAKIRRNAHRGRANG
ncbi:MAG: lipopolysaccharide kinase InaA family protein [Gemmataceae bacterium]|nr:lipopolysaccharide kinase InaA family protein [Gemmataceae bacterium]